jgi:hypothetical protein
VISFYVYEPAVHRVFVADQIWYFAELHGSTSLSSGVAHDDYAYSRKYWKGDDALFRPMALIWLAVDNTLFSYHHVLWNLATLVLHILVTLSLFNMLLEIQPTAFALPFASLFAVMTPALELVLWNHLGGYLLAYLFLTIALQRFGRMTVSGSTSATRHRRVCAFFYCSCFRARIAGADMSHREPDRVRIANLKTEIRNMKSNQAGDRIV